MRASWPVQTRTSASPSSEGWCHSTVSLTASSGGPATNMLAGMTASGAVGRILRSNSDLSRVVAAYGLFVITEYAAWMAVLVFAFTQGGAAEAGVVAMAQLIPTALVAPMISSLADRGAPARLLFAGYLAQAVGMAAIAVAIMADEALVAYGVSVLASTTLTTTRPAQMAALPTLATVPRDLTAANIALGWMENVGVVVAGLLSGLLLSAAGPLAVLVATTLLILGSATLVIGLVKATAAPVAPAKEPTRRPGAVHLLMHSPAPRMLVLLLAAESIVLGALDVLYIVLAIDVLGLGQGWVGYLQTAFGVGGIAAGVVTARLLGRRLSPAIAIAAVLAGTALALTAVAPGVMLTAFLIGGVGASRAVLDVAARTLLQRAVPRNLLGRVFGIVEASYMLGLAAGALLVPVLFALGGHRLAVLGTAVILPIAGVLGLRSLLRVDSAAAVQGPEASLLRSVPLFAGMPPQILEDLAGSMERQEIPPGTVLIREGEPGRDYYVIGSGELEISQAGRFLRRLGRGQGVGEIALLKDVPRTATVTATTSSVLYVLGRDAFLAAVTGHRGSYDIARTIADQRQTNVDP